MTTDYPQVDVDYKHFHLLLRPGLTPLEIAQRWWNVYEMQWVVIGDKWHYITDFLGPQYVRVELRFPGTPDEQLMARMTDYGRLRVLAPEGPRLMPPPKSAEPVKFSLRAPQPTLEDTYQAVREAFGRAKAREGLYGCQKMIEEGDWDIAPELRAALIGARVSWYLTVHGAVPPDAAWGWTDHQYKMQEELG